MASKGISFKLPISIIILPLDSAGKRFITLFRRSPVICARAIADTELDSGLMRAISCSSVRSSRKLKGFFGSSVSSS